MVRKENTNTRMAEEPPHHSQRLFFHHPITSTSLSQTILGLFMSVQMSTTFAAVGFEMIRIAVSHHVGFPSLAALNWEAGTWKECSIKKYHRRLFFRLNDSFDPFGTKAMVRVSGD